MNIVAVGFAAAMIALTLAMVGGAFLPRPARVTVAGVGTASAGLAGVVAGVAALAGQTFSVQADWLLPLTGVRLAVDPLSGLFLAVVSGVTVASAVYGIGYAAAGSGHDLDGRVPQAAFPAFVAAMLLVTAADGVGTFAVCWELMALASLVLVVTEHRRGDRVAEAGRWYAVMTQFGFLAILTGLLVLAARADGDSFAALREAGRQLSPAVGGAVFVTLLIGMGSKAGMAPLHVWLPRAHPEAPSHVSALMSAGMVNLGLYGLIRAGFDLLGGGARWWWLLVLAFGALSAVHGILHAAMSTDLKRLLGYSTTENVGLVLVGVGAAGLFTSAGQRSLADLALAAALLHVITHAAFKTLLFLSAGSVLRGTGTRDLDTLGGLRPRMPVTTAAFGLGALAASALPPGPAFVSEWLLLQGLVHGLGTSGVASSVVLPLAVAVVALTAGLAVATFVKAFGVGFLARPRSAAAGAATESPPAMLAGMAIAGLACVLVAVAPTAVVPALGPAVASSTGSAAAAVEGAVTLRLTGVAGILSPVLLAVALAIATAATAAAVRVLAVRPDRRTARLWDCGAGPMSARMEYTATSFAEPLQRVFDDVLRPEQDVDVTHFEESRYLVRSVEYRRRVPDGIEHRLYRPVLAFAAAWGNAGRHLANGSVHRYLGYGFGAVLAVFVILALAR